MREYRSEFLDRHVIGEDCHDNSALRGFQLEMKVRMTTHGSQDLEH
jgi:hypothetical protein